MAQVRLLSMQWWIQECSWGCQSSCFLRQVSLARNLSGTLPRLPHYVDIVAYDKTQEKKNLKQIFFPTITLSCLVTFWRKTTSIRLCFMDKKNRGGAGRSICFYTCTSTLSPCFQGQGEILLISCLSQNSFTSFSNPSPCSANVYASQGQISVSPSLSTSLLS